MNKSMLWVAPAVVALALTAAAADQPMMMKGAPPPKPIPSNYVQVSPCIPGMGAHYIDPKTFPNSPIYGVYRGKPVFTEVMVTPKDLKAGKSWDNVLRPLPGYSIDHVDFDYLPKGHPGMMFPHYDMHAFYVPHAAHMKFCPGPMGM